jgi:molybdenum cofactor sulfurtransferase
MVATLGEPWHVGKTDSIHESLEDGTLPFHSIIALGAAMTVHEEIYGSMANISRHTARLSKYLYDALTALRHDSGQTMCHIYKDPASTYGDSITQGASIAFNLQDSRGEWICKTEVETRASRKNIHIRSGGLCNPGGVSAALEISSSQLTRAYEAGLRCGDENDVFDGRPTGVVRVSLGAMSNLRDIDVFLDYVRDTYGNRGAVKIETSSSSVSSLPKNVAVTVAPVSEKTVSEKTMSKVRLFVESLPVRRPTSVVGRS